jgi:hypothetical protein
LQFVLDIYLRLETFILILLVINILVVIILFILVIIIMAKYLVSRVFELTFIILASLLWRLRVVLSRCKLNSANRVITYEHIIVIVIASH